MKKLAQITMLATIAFAAGSVAIAKQNPMVGGHEMFPTKNIVQNAMNSSDHTTLVAAVKAAGLVDTLEMLAQPQQRGQPRIPQDAPTRFPLFLVFQHDL